MRISIIVFIERFFCVSSQKHYSATVMDINISIERAAKQVFVSKERCHALRQQQILKGTGTFFSFSVSLSLSFSPAPSLPLCFILSRVELAKPTCDRFLEWMNEPVWFVFFYSLLIVRVVDLFRDRTKNVCSKLHSISVVCVRQFWHFFSLLLYAKSKWFNFLFF